MPNNTYENTPESSGECFERNAEGMLKNMAIHELALLVSFYDVTVENIESCVASWSKHILAPRRCYLTSQLCHSILSVEMVADTQHFRSCFSFRSISRSLAYTLTQPHFFSQDPDYITVKERVGNFCASGFPSMVWPRSIDIAVETLRVAEYLTPTLQEQLLSKE